MTEVANEFIKEYCFIRTTDVDFPRIYVRTFVDVGHTSFSKTLEIYLNIEFKTRLYARVCVRAYVRIHRVFQARKICFRIRIHSTIG